MALSDGSVDASYYTDSLGMHPDFVTGLKAIMAGTSPVHYTVCMWKSGLR